MAPISQAVVTGATGFVGSHLCRYLASREIPVRALVRAPNARKAIEVLSAIKGVELDFIDSESSHWLDLRGNETIFHLATAFKGVHQLQDVGSMIDANVKFATYVAEAASAAGCRFVNVGTAWQRYEESPYEPVSLYAATKQAFEDILLFYIRCSGLVATTVLLFDTYGPGDGRGKLVEQLLVAARTEHPLLMSSGRQLVNLLHVSDAVSGIYSVAEQMQVSPTQLRYSLPGDELLPLRELVRRIETVIERDIPVVWDARPDRVREMYRPWVLDAPPSGWKPQLDLERGIKQMWVEFDVD